MPDLNPGPWLSRGSRLRPSLPHPADLRRSLIISIGWLKRHRSEILVAVTITGVGAFLRLYRLDSIPAGVHGDEAQNAEWAHAILRGDWAGPYDPFHARGRPAGFGFWMAGVIALFGDSLFVIRMSTALLAIVTIPLAYLLFRVIDGKTTAAIGSSLLAVSGWHLLFSRTAWEPALLVAAEVLAALFVVLALRYQKWWLFPVAGVVVALGVYSHNSYPFFLVGIPPLLAIWLVRNRATVGRALMGATALVVAFFLTSLPMLCYIRGHEDVYLGRARSESIFNSTRFEEASGLGGQADAVLDSGRDFVQMMVFEGARDLPMLPVAISVLLGLGVLYAARRWWEPGIALAVILLFVIPWAAILNPSGASVMIRRSLGVLPFVVFLAALPLSAALRSKYLAGRYLRALGVVAALAVVGSVAVSGIAFYFGDFADSAHSKVNYPIVQASRFVKGLPGDPYVYFYSKRWAFNYEVRRYLAPDLEGEDRSGSWGSDFDLTPDRSRDVVYVFLDSFLDTSDDVQRLFPGGRASEFLDSDGTVLFRAYHLPKVISPGSG